MCKYCLEALCGTTAALLVVIAPIMALFFHQLVNKMGPIHIGVQGLALQMHALNNVLYPA